MAPTPLLGRDGGHVPPLIARRVQFVPARQAFAMR